MYQYLEFVDSSKFVDHPDRLGRLAMHSVLGLLAGPKTMVSISLSELEASSKETP